MSKENLVKKASAKILVAVPNEMVNAILDALIPEIQSPSSERSFTDVRKRINGIVILTEARDTTAMRAAVNSYLRWVQGVLDLLSGMG